WDVAGRRRTELALPPSAIRPLQFVPGGAALLAIATLERDSTLSIWDATTGREQGRLAVPAEPAFTPDGADVLAVTNDYRPMPVPGPTRPDFQGWGLSRW